jgi:site-specific DNA recombinase
VIVAIYARKSTEQHVADDQKSVARQIAHAREYANRHGWTVDESYIFVDDGISGAEFTRRPGFMRLLNALKPRPPFQVLVMSEESRLGREQIEVSYALKQLVQAGVRVFCYLDERERKLDSPIEKAMLALQTMADEMEREKARQRMVDTMLRKARSGHHTGGRCFGYTNVTITDADGTKSHVEQRINEPEAAVIRRIFELTAAGLSRVAIAKRLNAEGALAPRPQRGRPGGWAQSSVHEALLRERYRGEIVYNKTKKRDQFGERNPSTGPLPIRCAGRHRICGSCPKNSGSGRTLRWHCTAARRTAGARATRGICSQVSRAAPGAMVASSSGHIRIASSFTVVRRITNAAPRSAATWCRSRCTTSIARCSTRSATS